MHIRLISYQKIFPTGINYLNHRIGCEIELSPGEDAEEAFNTAKKFVDQMNIKSNPSYALAMEYHNGIGVGNPPIREYENVQEIKKDPKEAAIDAQIITLNSYTDAEKLKTFFEKLVKRVDDPRLTEAYESKLKSLQ